MPDASERFWEAWLASPQPHGFPAHPEAPPYLSPRDQFGTHVLSLTYAKRLRHYHRCAVGHTLEHHGLIKVPLAGQPAGIYWLRFYRGSARCVAVLTEVPGNPSRSVTNAISRISGFVAERFSVDLRDLVVFEIWPKRDKRPSRVKYVTFTDSGIRLPPGSQRQRPKEGELPFTGRPAWWSSTRKEVEDMVGVPLAELPPHDELYAAVKAMGGGTSEEVLRNVYSAVEVKGLPPPHNPSRCRYEPRFEQIQRELDGQGVVDELEAGRRFWETLSPEQCKRCPYHKADWASIADESVRVIGELGPHKVDDNYLVEAEKSRLPGRDKEWLLSLFYDPVIVDGGSYTNGQHRGCALRFSGAARAAVVTDLESLGSASADWVYLGDG